LAASTALFPAVSKPGFKTRLLSDVATKSSLGPVDDTSDLDGTNVLGSTSVEVGASNNCTGVAVSVTTIVVCVGAAVGVSVNSTCAWTVDIFNPARLTVSTTKQDTIHLIRDFIRDSFALI
jgi:hypothetical protein